MTRINNWLRTTRPIFAWSIAVVLTAVLAMGIGVVLVIAAWYGVWLSLMEG